MQPSKTEVVTVTESLANGHSASDLDEVQHHLGALDLAPPKQDVVSSPTVSKPLDQSSTSADECLNNWKDSKRALIESLANDTGLALESISTICSDFGTWQVTQRVVHDAIIDLRSISSMIYRTLLFHLPLLINFSTFQRPSHLRIAIW